MVTAWRHIHIPIKSTWRLSITFYMSGVEVETIPCGFGASTISWQYHLMFIRYQRIQWTSHIWADNSWGNDTKTDPYPHPQHIEDIDHFFMLWVDVGTISCGFRASTTVHGRIILHPAVTKDSSWPPESWLTNVVVSAWRQIHIPIHCIYSLSISFYMLWVDVGTIPCGFRASTTVHGHIIRRPAPTKDSSWPPWSWTTSVVVTG